MLVCHTGIVNESFGSSKDKIDIFSIVNFL
jgi:hypothetical protein